MAKGITPRGQDYSQWYIDVVLKGDMADYSPVKGCMVIKPNGYGVWENIQRNLDRMFKETGHVNAYFPMFIPESFLKKEAEHVEGFAPECAVVTPRRRQGARRTPRHPSDVRDDHLVHVQELDQFVSRSAHPHQPVGQRVPLGNADAPVPAHDRVSLAEGHTAHATFEEAEEETFKMVNVYKRFAEDYLAMPVIPGRKTDQEKFAGAVHTYCIEAMMQDGKALQAGTSHHLGQNFAKAFDVTFQDKDKEVKHVYASSWGVSTRLVGAMIMSHSDDNGLVIPPKLAPLPVVFVPIWRGDEEMALTLGKAREITQGWDPLFFKVDDRDQYKPGYKFAEWEIRGVPIRIEIGPRDVQADQVVVVRRDTGEKIPMPTEGLRERLVALLDDIQRNLFETAKKRLEDRTYTTDSYDDYKQRVSEGGFFRIHWCGSAACEKRIQEDTRSTIRCIPFDAPEESGKCLVCGADSNKRVIAAQAY